MMIVRARETFVQLAESHGLSLEWIDDAPVELCALLPKQPGLDWSLSLLLQNEDELCIQSEWFAVEWFPAHHPKREAEFIEALDGLLSGTVQLVCKFGRRKQTPYSVALRTDTGSLHQYYDGFHLGCASGTIVLRNGSVPVAEGRGQLLSVMT